MLNPDQWKLAEQAMLEFDDSSVLLAVSKKIDLVESAVKKLTKMPLNKQNTKQINELMDISQEYRLIMSKLRR